MSKKQTGANRLRLKPDELELISEYRLLKKEVNLTCLYPRGVINYWSKKKRYSLVINEKPKKENLICKIIELTKYYLAKVIQNRI